MSRHDNLIRLRHLRFLAQRKTDVLRPEEGELVESRVGAARSFRLRNSFQARSNGGKRYSGRPRSRGGRRVEEVPNYIIDDVLSCLQDMFEA